MLNTATIRHMFFKYVGFFIQIYVGHFVELTKLNALTSTAVNDKVS